MEVFRSLIFVPGNRKNMLEKATTFVADFVIPDLEDSVPLAEKENARATVSEAVPMLVSQGQRVIVRINSLDTGLAEGDIEAVASDKLYGISVGKIRSKGDVQRYDELLAKAESRLGIARGSLKLVLWLESAQSVLHAYEILTASDRVVATTLGGEDYTRDLGLQRTDTGEELFFPRAMLALAAHAAGVVPLDTPYVEFRNLEGLEREIRQLLRLGIKGKFAIHPAQLETINRLFSPDPSEVEYARRVVEAWEAAAASGSGAVSLDGKAVDIPVVERARDLLAVAEAIQARGGAQPSRTA